MPVILSLTCSRCRVAARVRPAAVLLDRSAESVSWICPTCRDLVEMTVGTELLDAAADAGASPITSALDRTHPESPPVGPHLSLDDLLELHRLLQQDAWFEVLSCFTTRCVD